MCKLIFVNLLNWILVEKKLIPEILPGNSVIRIDRNGVKDVRCQSIGYPGRGNSYLNWYREDLTGKRIPVDKSKITSSEVVVGTKNIDVVTLMFKMFSQVDVGTYVCQRKVGAATPTEKSFKADF